MNIRALRRQIEFFLLEDIGSGDITTEAVFETSNFCHAAFNARQPLVACGFQSITPLVFEILDPTIRCSQATADGVKVAAGEKLLEIQGPTLHVLQGERVALNLAQRLCGIATLTAEFVRRIAPLPTKIVDTRKTTPGLRGLEKYAVRAGGGHNHRFNLADGAMLKDNHIAACGSITQAVTAVRQRIPHTIKIEVETESLDQVRECLECGVEIIMLDNMEPALIQRAVELIAGRALVEASGGVTLQNVRQIAATGVDIISVGALTHSAPACDIGLDFMST